ncbi:hypothetical protein EVAR_11926_1 [Eumeta japonica]|uniref:Transmembrane protein 47 n=1 Tax=Eumeta variegata TaxID=151549 RepID=A0A4C1U8H7_EUMVA|nr:hypothetical protein EVAR_11926_1 [Eumeta japonica]
MRRAQARWSYIFRYVVVLRVYGAKLTRNRQTASGTGSGRVIQGDSAGDFLRPRDYRESVGVIALICGLLVVVLMVLGLASADWLMAAGWRQGLFMHCIDPNAPLPLPFDIVAQPGCYAARPAPYINQRTCTAGTCLLIDFQDVRSWVTCNRLRAAAGLCVATLAADVCGAVLTGLGLGAADHRTKFRYYRFAVLAMALACKYLHLYPALVITVAYAKLCCCSGWLMLCAVMFILIALVIYPVCFAAELNLGNRSVWEFGWAYGVGWGAAIFLFGAVVLLLCDKESEELYYKERKVSGERRGGSSPLGPRAPARPGAVSTAPAAPPLAGPRPRALRHLWRRRARAGSEPHASTLTLPSTSISTLFLTSTLVSRCVCVFVRVCARVCTEAAGAGDRRKAAGAGRAGDPLSDCRCSLNTFKLYMYK